MGVMFLPPAFQNSTIRSFSCTPLHDRLGLTEDIQLTPSCRFLPLNPLDDLESPLFEENLKFPVPFQIPPPRYAAGRV
jgi:hypothetical protein